MYTDILPDVIDQGVLLDQVYFYGTDSRSVGVVLTPTGEFAQNKVELVHVCAVVPIWELVSSLLKTDWKGVGLINIQGHFNSLSSVSNTVKKRFEDKLKNLIRQNFPRHYFFSPVRL